MPEAVPLPILFRPSPLLRGIAAAAGLICVVTAGANLYAFTLGGGFVRLIALLVTAAPAVLAAGLMRRKIVVDRDLLITSGLLRTRSIPWPEVMAIEQTRRSFVIITEQGDVSAGWIDASRRDLLFRKVLELAHLALDPHEPRWGITGRFVRRASPGFISPADIVSSRSKEPKHKHDSDY
jgi:hypothetical protein